MHKDVVKFVEANKQNITLSNYNGKHFSIRTTKNHRVYKSSYATIGKASSYCANQLGISLMYHTDSCLCKITIFECAPVQT